MDALKVDHLVKNYDKLQAVKGVSFTVAPGEIFGLLGPNGAGKTSIISTIVTLEEPTSGSVQVFGHDVSLEPRQAKVLTGFVPQEVINHGYFTVEEILRLHSGFFGIRENKERIEFLLERLGLSEHRAKKVRQLSGGMKRRLMIAKALVHSPKILLLDEPTAGVDIELRQSLWEFVEELRGEGVSVLLTTHYLEEAQNLCDRVGVIHQGSMLKMGPTGELIRELTQKLVRIFLQRPVDPISHPCLVLQRQNLLEFKLPQDGLLGRLLSEISVSADVLRDIQIVEGDLEDAFRVILGGQS